MSLQYSDVMSMVGVGDTIRADSDPDHRTRVPIVSRSSGLPNGRLTHGNLAVG